MSKLIILGAPLTGKTSLTVALRKVVSIPVLDFDEELMKLNNGKYPANYLELNERLKKQVILNISQMDTVVFFAFEISVGSLKMMKQDGFKVIQLTAPINILKARNQKRLKNDPTNDAFQYVTTNLEYQNEMKKLGLVDIIIDTSKEELNKTLKSITKLI